MHIKRRKDWKAILLANYVVLHSVTWRYVHKAASFSGRDEILWKDYLMELPQLLLLWYLVSRGLSTVFPQAGFRRTRSQRLRSHQDLGYSFKAALRQYERLSAQFYLHIPLLRMCCNSHVGRKGPRRRGPD